MDNANEHAANGCGTVTVGGTTYLVGQPTDQDMATVRNYFRRRLQAPLAAVAEELAGLTPAQRALVGDAAVRAAVELKAGGGAGMTPSFFAEQLRTPDGAAFLVWTLVRKNHPGVTLETVRTGVTEENAPALVADVFEASGMRDAMGLSLIHI